MKVLTCEVTNFGSYERLEFQFLDQGLCLVSGPTGSGKSTLCDVIPWALFGVTAKNGSVDEVRKWESDSTHANIVVQVGDKTVQVLRTRGKGMNDLCYSLGNAELIRGKDLNDTQKLLNQELGLDAETYLAGAYYHEFAPAASFFSANAKTRRQLTEQIIDLSLATTLTANVSEYKKSTEADRAAVVRAADKCETSITHVKDVLHTAKHNSEAWESRTRVDIALMTNKAHSFNSDKDKAVGSIKDDYTEKRMYLQESIDKTQLKIKPDSHYETTKDLIAAEETALGDDKCHECGAPKNVSARMSLTKRQCELKHDQDSNDTLKIKLVELHQQLDRLNEREAADITRESSKANPFNEVILDLKTKHNPFTTVITAEALNLSNKTVELDTLRLNVSHLTEDLSDLELLQDVVAEFRAQCVKNAIIELETHTNTLLSKHFDAEIKVGFECQEADKINVTIYKGANVAAFTQLSKGQRQLLKLSFSLSVMRMVSNHTGVKFSTIFLDEVTDGLDEDFKSKVFDLLQTLELEYDSIFVTDHSSELKSRFLKSYNVALINGSSNVEEA